MTMNSQTKIVVQMGIAATGAHDSGPLEAWLLLSSSPARRHSPLTTKRPTSQPNHSDVTMTAAGPPFATTSPQPRIACRASVRQRGHVRSLFFLSTNGVAMHSTHPCSSSPILIANGAPTKPRVCVSTRQSTACMKLPPTLTTMGKRTQRCALRKDPTSERTMTPGSERRRSQTNVWACAATERGRPAALSIAPALAVSGSDMHTTMSTWIANTRIRSRPMRRWLPAPKAWEKSGMAPNVDDLMSIS
eukprot:3724017-Prymnesium_polylepis.1